MSFDFSRNLDSGFIFANKFPHPFFDIANTFLPREINQTFQWCEFIFFSNGIVRSATSRVSKYFVTEIEYENENSAQITELDEILQKKIKIKKLLTNIATDFVTYGNSIVVIYLPKNRTLVCPKCSTRYNIKKIDYTFSEFKFKAKCEKCNFRGEFKVEDVKSNSPGKINIIRMDPKQIEIDYNEITGESRYFWKIPQSIHRKVADGNKLILSSIPLEMLEAMKGKKKFELNENIVFHLKDSSLAGISKEWGFPIYLTIMKLNYYSAVLRRANEAIALDFVVPFRVISPSQGSSQGDPIANMNLQKFVSEMQFMILRHRYDPANIQVSPVPLSYQAFGAEKKTLDLVGELKQNTEEMLHSLDYPAELFFNTLNIQALPTALRLFENSFVGLVDGLNDVLKWASDHITSYLGHEKAEPKLTRVTVADDIEKRSILMNLASAQQLSMITALKSYGLDFEKEQRTLAEQAKIIKNIQEEYAKDMKEEAGMPGSPAAQASPSPFDLVSQAEMLAQSMLQMPEGQRRSQLIQMSKDNPTLHALTKEKMEDIRQTARTQRGYETLSQLGMGGTI